MWYGTGNILKNGLTIAPHWSSSTHSTNKILLALLHGADTCGFWKSIP
jgi:hypothetical protein